MIMTKVLTTKIEEDLFQRFKSYCEEKNLLPSKALRDILHEKLDKKEGFFYKEDDRKMQS